MSELEIEHAIEAGLFTAVVDYDDLRSAVKSLDVGESVTPDPFTTT